MFDYYERLVEIKGKVVFILWKNIHFRVAVKIEIIIKNVFLRSLTDKYI